MVIPFLSQPGELRNLFWQGPGRAIDEAASK
jgi:hypothetical protein